MYSPITEKIIYKEANAIAIMLGIRCEIKVEYNTIDNKIYLKATHKNKYIEVRFEQNDLLRSIDDLNEFKIFPALKQLLTKDLWFIHNEIT